MKALTTCNLFAIFKYFATPERASEVVNQKESKALYENYMQDTQKIDLMLSQGKERMREITKPLLRQVRKAIGII